MTLSLIIILPFAGALIAGFLPAHARNTAIWLSSLVTFACTALIVSLFPAVTGADGVIRERLSWAPQLGLDLYLRMDGYAWLFAMLVAVMGVLVVLYARYYMSPADPVPRFFSFLLAFMGAMLGIVLSGNLIQLVLFWELTSFTSFMLIAYWYHRADARRGARMALTVTAAGGLCLLVGDADARRHRRQLRPRSWSLPLASDSRACAVPPHARADPARRAHEERAIPVSFLAAACHGGADAGVGLSAFGDDGQGRRVLLARLWPALAGTEGVVLDLGARRLASRCCSARVARSSSAI